MNIGQYGKLTTPKIQSQWQKLYKEKNEQIVKDVVKKRVSTKKKNQSTPMGRIENAYRPTLSTAVTKEVKKRSSKASKKK